MQSCTIKETIRVCALSISPSFVCFVTQLQIWVSLLVINSVGHYFKWVCWLSFESMGGQRIEETLVTEWKTLVTKGKTLVTKVKTLVTIPKPKARPLWPNGRPWWLKGQKNFQKNLPKKILKQNFCQKYFWENTFAKYISEKNGDKAPLPPADIER